MNIADVEGAFAHGKVKFDEAMQEFETKWFMPYAAMKLGNILFNVNQNPDLMQPEKVNTLKNLYRKMTGDTDYDDEQDTIQPFEGPEDVEYDALI